MASSWQTVRGEFIRRINEREWPPGEIIPTEAQLCQELSCSRVTVNRALRDLAESGLLDRKRKAGTRVLQNPERKATFSIPVIRLEVEASGGKYGHRLLKLARKVAPTKVLKRMALAPETELLCLHALHMADDKPFALEERWINLAVVPELEKIDFEVTSANEWLVSHAPFSRGDLSLGACSANKSLAARLQCELGLALLEIERSTWKGDESITLVRLVYAPGYRLQTVL